MFDSQQQSTGTAYTTTVALSGRWTGMPCVSVSAYMRHIQKDSGRQRDDQKIAIHSSAIEAEST